MKTLLFRAFAIVLLIAAAPASAQEVDGKAILRQIDDLYRGQSSAARTTMHIKTEHWERTLEMQVYSQGTERSLVRIVRPKQEEGTATLKVEDNIWNYLPKTRRVMKIPASMMMGSWMGSHFTNDDLVQRSRLEEDYDFELEDRATAGRWLITLIPHEDAPVVWGKIVIELQKQPLLPIWMEYYDEDGEAVRRSTYEDVQTVSGRTLPLKMRMVPLEEPGEFTEIHYRELRFDVELEDSLFSIQALKRR